MIKRITEYILTTALQGLDNFVFIAFVSSICVGTHSCLRVFVSGLAWPRDGFHVLDPVGTEF